VRPPNSRHQGKFSTLTGNIILTSKVAGGNSHEVKARDKTTYPRVGIFPQSIIFPASF